MDLRIIDDSGNNCQLGAEGDIALNTTFHRPPGLFVGYVDDPVRTASVFVERGGEKFYLTGDRGYLDEDGYLWFVGRGDDVIITSGYRVGPFEVESALIAHPDVVEAAVIGASDPVRGQIVRAFVVLTERCKRRLAEEEEEEDSVDLELSDPSTERSDMKGRRKTEKELFLAEELKAFVKKQTAPYKYPRRIDFVEELPKTISGKIRRVELREENHMY